MENNSGWFPICHCILIKPEDPKITKSVIFVPAEFTQRDEAAATMGTVVALGPEAWSDKRNQVPLRPGQVVLFRKLAGYFIEGEDGVKYRMINDLDITAVKGVRI